MLSNTNRSNLAHSLGDDFALNCPSISVAIPTYNEADCIESVIRQFLATQYSNLLEILVADGGSTDGTQAIVQQLEIEDSRVKLLNNPLKIQSAGLNIALGHSHGDIFLRADAHSEYAEDYIEQCVEALLQSKALNVGGAQRFIASTPFQAGLALASKSILGNGGAKYRDSYYDGYAETVYLGCFWRFALMEIAGYDVKTTNEDAELNLRLQFSVFAHAQRTNQDSELNLRLLDKHQNAIYISSKIRVWYYPRKTWSALWQQYFRYGRGRYRTASTHRNHRQLRGKLPFIVVSGFIGLMAISLFVPALALIFAIVVSVGTAALIGESLRVTFNFRQEFDKEIWRGDPNKRPSLIECWFYCMISLSTMPIAHFCGYGYQLVRHRVLRVSSW